jgi:peptide/nickel transport system ATP-binding protein
MEEKEIVLQVNQLSTSFRTDRGMLRAVQGVSFSVRRGEILGLVGESGCGKSVTSMSIMRLYDEKYMARYEGEVLLEGRNILDLPFREMQNIRGRDISMIFQDALSSLNPVLRISDQIMEPLRIHQHMGRKEAYARAVEMLRLVGIPSPETRVDQYPHELSGGMLQRAMIAAAIVTKPKLLLADEITTALDVSMQARILELLRKLNRETKMAILFISHDLHVVNRLCTKVIVMQRGKIVESGNTQEVFANPQHPYTKKLIAAIPSRRSTLRN